MADLFNFELFAFEDVVPWTTPAHGNAKSLGWFGLTQGWYWIDTGAGELFRYSAELLAQWGQKYPQAIECPYVDYFVVRLWEDVLEMLPTVLEPIPDDLARYLQPDGAWGTCAGWKHWSQRAWEWAESHAEEAEWDGMLGWNIFDKARHWWEERRLDTGYLNAGPAIWFWRESDQIQIQWDNQGISLEGSPAWAAKAGHVSLPVEDFLAEVRSFDERLIRAMAERVDFVRYHGSHPGVRIDWEHLRREHRRRCAHGGDILTGASPQTDWGMIRTALLKVDRHLKEASEMASE